MPDELLTSPHGPVPAYLATPAGSAPAPGVVVLHDLFGLRTDARAHTDWFAAQGFLAAAPDLFLGDDRPGCVVRALWSLITRDHGPKLSAIEACRARLLADPRSTGRVGVIGFCMGGGFALMLAPRGDFHAASVNYGVADPATWRQLAGACPIVASFGARDWPLRGAATRLRTILQDAGVPHDVHEYPGVGHSFMNDHPPGDLPWIIYRTQGLSQTRFCPAATADARRRILDFFAIHLAGLSSGAQVEPDGGRDPPEPHAPSADESSRRPAKRA